MARGILSRMLSDSPPRYVFELSEAGIAAARVGSPPEVSFRPLPAETIAVSPVRDNVLRMDELTRHVAAFASSGADKKRQRAVLILPDFSVRVSVLDFDSFPQDPEQQRSLVRFRIKKSLPFELDAAALSYSVQHGGDNGKHWDVVVAVAPVEILARYEAPFRAAGFQPGFVTTSSLCAIEMVKGDSVAVMAKLSGRTLILALIAGGVLKLHRAIEVAGAGPVETASHLFPTFAYAEDQLQARPDRVLLSGFSETAHEVRSEIERDLQVAVEPLRSKYGNPDAHNAGLLGYLESAEEF